MHRRTSRLLTHACWSVCTIAIVHSTAAAQQAFDSTVSPAALAARAVRVTDYFAVGMLSGAMAGARLPGVAFTGDRRIASIGVSTISIVTLVATWRSADRVVIPRFGEGEKRVPSSPEWSAIYKSTLIDRRRNALVVGFVTGAAFGVVFLFLPSLLPET